MTTVAAVILAAGMGTRMRSRLVKVLHPLGGRPMLEHVVESVQSAGVSRTVVVVGHQADAVRAGINADADYVVQKDQLGTAHAVLQAAGPLSGHRGPILVTYGDTPLYRPETYRRFIQGHSQSDAVATLLSTFVEDPRGYGRVLRDSKSGNFQGIVEQRDITSDEVEATKEINTGTYCFDGPALFDALKHVKNDNRQREYYLPDALKILREAGEVVTVHVLEDATEALGINDRRQLAQAERILRYRILDRLMESGVTIVDPESTFVHDTVRIGKESTIYPFTILEGDTQIGESCKVGPYCRVRDARIGDNVVIDTSAVTGSRIGDGARVGPYSHLRPGSEIGTEQHVGAFEAGEGLKL